MRMTLAASAVMLVLMAPAESAEKQVWGFVKSADEVRLFYGIPESGTLTIAFACETKPKRIAIISSVLPAKPRRGQSSRTTLSNGVAAAAYDGTFGHTESEGFYFEASIPAGPKVVGILKSGATLTIAIPGKREGVPLRGVAGPLAQFETGCFGKH